MTEKRFYTDGQYVMQKGEVWVVAGGEHSADVIATALNELIEERNKLQFDYNMEVLTRQSIEKKNKQLEKENLDLKNSICFDELATDAVCQLIIKKDKEIRQLKEAYQTLKHRHSLLHDECLEIECDRDSLKKDVISLEKENEQLKQELFESKKDYIIETYSNNPVRRDKKLQVLKEEFKERFGNLTYITSDELLFDIINETIEKGNSDD